MSVSLSRDVQRMIEEAMKRFGYRSADEAVRAGLALLEQTDTGEFSAGELEHILEEGEQSGECLDGEHVLAELAAMRAGRRGKSA